MAKTKFQILRKDGFILNTNDKIVNGILKGLDRCGGKCPCYHKEEGDETPDEDLMCPCKEYRENNHCRCNLYVLAEDCAVDVKALLKENLDIKTQLIEAHNEIRNLTNKKEKLVY